MDKRKELIVSAIENGTVIDHIPSDSLFKVVDLLGIQSIKNNVTIGYNLDSKKYGKKGIIKVANITFPEATLNRIAIIAPNAVINIIKDYEVVEKRKVELPDNIYGIVKCSNPKCITNNEPMRTHFHVIDRENMILKCHYCERTEDKDKITLK